MSFYEIDASSDRVNVKRERVDKLLRERQYAAILGNRLLAAIPKGESAGFELVLVDLDASTYIRLDGRNSAQAPREVADLLSALRERFGIVNSDLAGSITLSPVAARN